MLYHKLEELRRKYKFPARSIRGIYKISQDPEAKHYKRAKEFISNFDINFYHKYVAQDQRYYNEDCPGDIKQFFEKVKLDVNSRVHYYGQTTFFANKLLSLIQSFYQGDSDEVTLVAKLCLINYYSKKLRRSLDAI